MSDKSPIEWTDATWNPVRGCTRVSPGCGGPRHQGGCYAERIAARFSDPGQPFHGFAERTPLGGRWTGKLALVEEKLTEPLSWKKPRRIFVNSMSDLFHENLSDEAIDRVFAVMALCPQHIFQVLTKRSARMREYFRSARPAPVALEAMEITLLEHLRDANSRVGAGCIVQGDIPHLKVWPLPNVWLGVSCEDQARADERIPDLLATPAHVRFVSAEPLLGPIDFTRLGTLDTVRSALPSAVEREERGKPKAGNGSICGVQIDAVGSPGSSITFFQTSDHMGGFTVTSPRLWPRLDWIIVGGESQSGARPMHPDWARSIRDQCAAAGTAFFFKQWGAWAPGECANFSPKRSERTATLPFGGFSEHQRWDYGSVTPRQSEETHRDDAPDLYLIGKKRAGCLLDGIEHSAFPEARA